MFNNKEPLVSICCITYNHADFIKDALDGFLMQKTSFPFEIIIHDDASIDGTAQIVTKYADAHQKLIIPILQKENQYSKGLKALQNFVWQRARGKYIAHCEGDDYWTDPNKLQKQIDFLEANPEFSFCFHDAFVLNQSTGKLKKRIGDRKIDEVVDVKSVIIQNNIPTASLVFRNNLDFNKLPEWFFKTSKGDYGLVILLAEKGMGKYIHEVMSVYRVHEGGAWSGQNIDYYYNEGVKFYNYLFDYFNTKTIKKIIKEKIVFTKFNYGIGMLRQGNFVHGLYLVLTNGCLNKNKRIRPVYNKIPRALFSGLKCIIKK